MKKFIFNLLLLVSAGCFAQKQVWKAAQSSNGQFTFSRDGQQVACLSNGTALAVGGWHVNNDTSEVCREVYASTDQGQTWTREADAPWPAAHDFLFSASITGDTLVKWGGDGATEQTGDARRIDMYTSAEGWQNLTPDYGEEINNGLELTGCRHKQWYYMLGANGKLTRFSLANPTPQFVAGLSGDMNVISGFMISLPNGRMILGGGLCIGYDSPVFTGKLFYSDDDGITWNELYQNDQFKNYWCTATVTKSSVLFWKGRDGSPAGGLKGVYTIPLDNLMYGAGADQWTRLDYTPEPRHAAGLTTVPDEMGRPTDAVIGVCGNMYNDSWIFRRIDNMENGIILSDKCSFTMPDMLDTTGNTDKLLSFTQSPAAGSLIGSSNGQVHKVVITGNYNGHMAVTDTFYLRTKDTIAPRIHGLADTLVYLAGNYTVTIPDLRRATAASDGCGVVLLTQQPVAGQIVDASSGLAPTITITATDAAGNSSSWQTRVRLGPPLVGGIPDIGIMAKLQVIAAPNPTTQFFTVNIQSANPEPVKVRVLNASGMQLEAFETSPNVQLHIGQAYPAGLYILDVQQGGERRIFKLVRL
jgi:hypothetical protein